MAVLAQLDEHEAAPHLVRVRYGPDLPISRSFPELTFQRKQWGLPPICTTIFRELGSLLMVEYLQPTTFECDDVALSCLGLTFSHRNPQEPHRLRPHPHLLWP